MSRRTLALSLAALLTVTTLTGCGGDTAAHSGELRPPLSAEDADGLNYQDVVKRLEAAGFTNVDTEVLDDLITGWLTSDGEVERVSINGVTDFAGGDWFPADASVVVSYHTFPADAPTDDGSAEVPAIPSAQPSETASEDGTAGSQTCESSSFGDTCKFGQTTIYSDSTDDGELRLEITVSGPVTFTPSEDAYISSAFAHEQPARPENVYFTVTVENVSEGAALDGNFFFTHATDGDEGETDMLSVSDEGIEGPPDMLLAPGESTSFKDGWSFSSIDDELEYVVRIDGLAGGSVRFQN